MKKIRLATGFVYMRTYIFAYQCTDVKMYQNVVHPMLVLTDEIESIFVIYFLIPNLNPI